MAALLLLAAAPVAASAAPSPAARHPAAPSPAAGAGGLPGPGCMPLLDAPAGGDGAVAELGGDGLAAAAALNGMDAQGLAGLLRSDASARLDVCGALFYVEAPPPARPAPAAGSSPAAPGDAGADDAGAGDAGADDGSSAPGQLDASGDAFALHSRPGSQRTIYLDFTGFQLTGTAWNAGEDFAPITGADYWVPAFSLDADPGTFTDAERDVVRDVWQRVAEDYAPFDVDVTTADPGQDAITRAGAADQVYGTRALVTGDEALQEACGCGGVAYVGVFDATYSHAYYQPALVFSAGSGATGKGIAEAASHEVGHNLGLRHDGSPTSGYYAGHGPWAPVMGVGYYRPVTQWSRGEYAGATNTEDDLAVIGSNGLARVPDEAPGAAGSGTAVALGADVDGIVSDAADTDRYRFATGGGAVTATATTLRGGADLDVRLTLYDAAGAVVATADPPAATVDRYRATGLDATVTASVAAGTYEVAVEGTGYGDPATTGYGGYGSLGTYRLRVDAPAAPAARYVPLAAPVRLMDTRPGAATADGQSAGGGRRGWREVTALPVGGRGGIPASAGSVVLNVTAVGGEAPGFVTVYPCGVATPNASSLNFAVGQTAAAAAVARVGSGGAVCLMAAAPVHLVVDASGYFPTTADLVPLAAPARLMDTRPGGATADGQYSGTGVRSAWQTTELPVAGRGGVPAGAASAVLTVTVTQPAWGGYVTVFPCGAQRPNASDVNFAAGQTVAGAVFAKVGAGGKVCVFTATAAHVVVDVAGYFPDATAFAPLAAPVRLLETRSGPGYTTVDGLFQGLGRRAGAQVTELAVAGRGGLPAGAASAVLTVTATEAGAAGYVTVYPCGVGTPLASTLNVAAGATVANAVVAKVGAAGKVCLYTSAPTHLVVDAAGSIG